MRKNIYLTESQLVTLSESNDEVTFYKFFNEVKNFIKRLLDDPINAKPSLFFKEHNISKSKLLNKMLDRGIITKKEDIREPNDADGKMKSMHYIQYKVPKKNFEQKIRRLYSYFFEKNNLKESVGNINGYNSVATYIFCNDKMGNLCVLGGKRRGNNNGGKYNVPTGLVGDRYFGEIPADAAVREVMEESGISIQPSFLKDIGDEQYMSRYGSCLGKNYVALLNGTVDDYRPGVGDGENDRFEWIPITNVGKIDWAFGMGEKIMEIVNKIRQNGKGN